MNTTMLVLAVLCWIVAVFAACRRDGPTAAAGVTGALLFGILAIMFPNDHERRDY
jgi:hypothetical protein